MTMTREEHLQWCKDRALKYVEAGDLHNAFASMMSDLSKHPETSGAGQSIGLIGMGLLIAGHLNAADAMRDYIEGFN